MVLKWQAVLGYLMFPVVLHLFRVLFGCLAAVLARSLTHGTYMVHRETFFLIHSNKMKRQLLSSEIQEVLQRHNREPVSLNT